MLTNHTPKSVTLRHYMETSHLQYLRADIQKLADWYDTKAAIYRSQQDGSNVVPLRA